jgi:hypothetical protein
MAFSGTIKITLARFRKRSRKRWREVSPDSCVYLFREVKRAVKSNPQHLVWRQHSLCYESFPWGYERAVKSNPNGYDQLSEIYDKSTGIVNGTHCLGTPIAIVNVYSEVQFYQVFNEDRARLVQRFIISISRIALAFKLVNWELCRSTVPPTLLPSVPQPHLS